MKEPHTIFQDISIRRKIIISMGMLTMLIIVIGLYNFIVILDFNQHFHKSVLEGRTMANAIDTARLSQVHFKKQVQEWKNILLRGNDKDLFDKHLRVFNEEEQKVNEYLKSLSQIASSSGMSIPQIADVIKVHEKLGHQYREALKKYKQSDLKSAVLVDKSIRGIDRQMTDDIDTMVLIIKNISEKRLKEMEVTVKTKLEAFQALSFFIIILVIVSVGFGIFNAWSITKDMPSEENRNSSKKKKVKRNI
jgi:methyl-accepting chemotaxis protein